MRRYDQVLNSLGSPDGGRLKDFFDIEADPNDVDRILAKTISHFQDQQEEKPVLSNSVSNYKVSGWDEIRIIKYIQNKLPEGTKKSSLELFSKIKMFSQGIQLPAIWEDEWGNIWTKE